MIEKTLKVDLRPAEAFDLFARRMGDWWPAERLSVAAERGERPAAVVVEPREGGAVYETDGAGTQFEWGRVALWAPGERLDLDWWPGRTEADATRVSVRFLAEAGGTRVDLIHSGLDGREGIYGPGWEMCLSRYGAMVPA